MLVVCNYSLACGNNNQLQGVETIGPITYTACRYFISTILILFYKNFVHTRISLHTRHSDIGNHLYSNLCTILTIAITANQIVDLLFVKILGKSLAI